jgi:hypothetical protein
MAKLECLRVEPERKLVGTRNALIAIHAANYWSILFTFLTRAIAKFIVVDITPSYSNLVVQRVMKYEINSDLLGFYFFNMIINLSY